MRKIYLILFFIGLVFLFPIKAEAKLCWSEERGCNVLGCPVGKMAVWKCSTTGDCATNCPHDTSKVAISCVTDSSCDLGSGGGGGGSGAQCCNNSSCAAGYECVGAEPGCNMAPTGINPGDSGQCTAIENAGGSNNGQAINIKCDCATDFGDCGSKFGKNNIQWRQCTLNPVRGAQTCNWLANLVPYQYKTCSPGATATPGGPTITPTPRIYKCNCTGVAFPATCQDYPGHENSKRRACPFSATGQSNCVKIGTRYFNYLACHQTSPTPTPGAPTITPNPNCKCTSNSCTTQCSFEGVTDATSMKCSLSTSLFPTPPSAANKEDWCQRPKRSKGDADGVDGVKPMDYMYYVSAVNGGKIPSTVNPDFNGDGEVGLADRNIVINSL